MNTFLVRTRSLLISGFLLAACAAPPAEESPVSAELTSPSPPQASFTPPPLTSTIPIPTATAIPPTSPPATSTRPKPSETPVITESIAVKAEDIVGIWKTFYKPLGGRAFIQYKPDGTWAIAKTIEGLDHPTMRGTFSFDGEEFITYDADCGTGKYTVRLQFANGVLIGLAFTKIEDTCKERSRDLYGGMKWVQP